MVAVSLTNELVSVLTPTIAGREWFLQRNKASIASQTHQPIEHVVVDGNGLSATEAFQSALELARGEYVIPVSDDDWIAPHAVETLLATLGGSDCAFGSMLIVNVDNRNSRLVEIGGAVMWRKSLTDRIGGFDTSFRYAGDTELYSRILSRNDVSVAYRHEPLYFFTEHESHGSFLHHEELSEELKTIETLHPESMSVAMTILEKGRPVAALSASSVAVMTTGKALRS